MSLIISPHSFLISPIKQWSLLAERPLKDYFLYLYYPLLLAVLPAVAWYYGITQTGWQVGDGSSIRLTNASAAPIVVLFYIAMLVAIVVIGYLTHWMSKTYGAETSIAKGISVVGFVATPLFLAGVVGFHPMLWIDMLVGIVAIGWSIYLLYTGIPIVMKLPPERGFLYASAVVGVGLVIFICILVATVLLWDFVAMPEFTD